MKDWLKESITPEIRKWEEMYRNRFQHDKRVRTTHGVNCTGGCSWEVYVKDGIVTWELQAIDYPRVNEELPPYEPRGCPRGISFSWYLYSPLRVKYPYIRGTLIDLWREARQANRDPVAAWESIVKNPDRRVRYQQARGKGGFRRLRWEEAIEIIAAATIYTIKTYGPDRIMGFSPIPAMSQVSYASGSRFLSLLGGVVLSFYDWYADLPPASPEVWGEQTDVHESADWFNARFIASVGSNVNQTRSPDAHYLIEARHAGAKVAVFSPEFSQTAKEADWWLPIRFGQDAAFWMAVNHVILKEFYVDRQVPRFIEYLKRYTDMPFLVEIKDGKPDQCFRANRLPAYQDIEHGDWKLLVWDAKSAQPHPIQGTLGYRWAQENPGKWNLESRDGETGSELDPMLTFIDACDDIAQVDFNDFTRNTTLKRGVPVRHIETSDGRVTLATIFDVLMAHFGVSRGLEGSYGSDENDETAPYTPAWQEKYTGIHRDSLIHFARQWTQNAEQTNGKNMIIIGSGVNHWYHTNLIYRAAISALMLTGSIGVNGGGLAHYVGQEKVAPLASWANIAFAHDWKITPRLQNTPSFHYVHTDQWRYEQGYTAYDPKRPGEDAPQDHTIDEQIRAVRRGWLPFFPQFDKNSIQLANEAQINGATNNQEIVNYVVDQLKSGKLGFSVQDPDAPENWPRLWFVWRANAIGSSAKGHEYFLKHYLGAHSNDSAPQTASDYVKEAKYRDDAPTGKLDLVIDLDFRMSTSALYADIVLPAATWYEKDDLNTTDLHSFLHPMQEAVHPAWESKNDWEIFKAIAKRVSELAATHFPAPAKDVVMLPLMHDTPDEMTQLTIQDWSTGEVDPIPGKTMPKFHVLERSYSQLYEQMTSLGRGVAENGVKANGITIPVHDIYRELQMWQPPAVRTDGKTDYPALESARQVAEAILALDPVSNGELAYRAFESLEKETGLKLTDLAESMRGVKYTFSDIVAQPRRVLTTPTWSGIVNNHRAYSPYTQNVERLIPWRTLTGRQHFYLDHQNYIAFGENMPIYKAPPTPDSLEETSHTKAETGSGRLFRYLTPHGKWGIHTTFSDNIRMMTLSRGCYPVWLNDQDAAELGIADNDWVEIFNDNGVFVQRCIASARIPRGSIFVYHATERTIGIPKSPLRHWRAGIHSSCIRTRLKPVLMSGGYAQFTYFFNYWGPTGVNRDSYVFIHRIEKPEF